MTNWKNAIVKFRNPEPNEIGERFEVIEDRDDRVLVRSITYHFGIIEPTFVYLKTDLEIL